MVKKSENKHSRPQRERDASQRMALLVIQGRWQSSAYPTNLELWVETTEILPTWSFAQLQKFTEWWLALILSEPIDAQGFNGILNAIVGAWPFNELCTLYTLLRDFRNYLQCASAREGVDEQVIEGLTDIHAVLTKYLLSRELPSTDTHQT